MDTAFVTFDSIEHGVRAMAVILLNYQRVYGLRTIQTIIRRWAPWTENDTGAYVSAVVKDSGYSMNAFLVLSDRATLWRIVAAIIHHENGLDAQLILPVTISRGVNLALQA